MLPIAQLQRVRTAADAGLLAREWGKAASEEHGPAGPVAQAATSIEDVIARLDQLEDVVAGLLPPDAASALFDPTAEPVVIAEEDLDDEDEQQEEAPAKPAGRKRASS